MVVRNLESIRLFLKSMCIIPEYQKQRESSGHPQPLGIGVTMWDEVQMNIESSRNHSYSGAPRARKARAERSTMGKKIW